jgi:MFS family permease
LRLTLAAGPGQFALGMISGVGFFAAMLGSAAMTARLGRQILPLGSLVVAGGCLLLAWAAGGTSSVELLPGLAVTGFGIGMVLVPLSSAVLRDVDPRHVGAASGVFATAQQVGGALGVAVVGVVLYRALHAGAFPHAFGVRRPVRPPRAPVTSSGCAQSGPAWAARLSLTRPAGPARRVAGRRAVRARWPACSRLAG